MEFNVALDPARFAKPAVVFNYSFSDAQSKVDIPFVEMGKHQILVDVKINDQGPFHFILDTGGHNALSPNTAKRLGLIDSKIEVGEISGGGSETVTAGAANIKTLEVGGLVLRDQTMMVLPFPGDDIDGMLGYELLNHFPVRIDYKAHRVSVFEPKTFHYDGLAKATSLEILADLPVVDGQMDGISAKFFVDTGAYFALQLDSDFVDKQKLVSKYGAKTKVSSGLGIGGRSYALLARAHEFKIGESSISSPTVYLSTTPDGMYASLRDAGLKDIPVGFIGHDVLQRFNIIFDYAQKKIYFEPNAHNEIPDDLTMGYGLDLQDVSGKKHEVKFVVKGAPAALAKINVGDHIVSIDGDDSSSITHAAMLQRFEPKSGKKLRLGIESHGATRVVELEPRDLIELKN